jgi:hypothetical protein
MSARQVALGNAPVFERLAHVLIEIHASTLD